MSAKSGLRGHTSRPHTADAVIEAWAPNAAGCYEEAVAAFVEIFADTTAAPEGSPTTVEVGPGDPEELLVLLLEEVLLGLEAGGVIPTAAHLQVRDDVLSGTLSLVPAAAAVVVGPVPKGVSYHLLNFVPVGSGWHCQATVDV